MDLKQRVLAAYSEEEVHQLLHELGSASPLSDGKGNWIYQTVCHNPMGGGKHKLYYYPESRSFYCYSECGAISLFQLVMNTLGFSFKDALYFLAKRVGMSPHEPIRGFITSEATETVDLGWVKPEVAEPVVQTLPHYDASILSLFSPYYPKSWQEEGICPLTAETFDLRFDLEQNKAIIPYRNLEGQLIGIRGRSFNPWEEAAGYKYMPVKVGDIYYKHPIQLSLYGLYEHQDAIKRYKRVVLFEGEKSVMIHHSWYGEDSVALGLGGIHLSHTQRSQLLDLGVERVVIGVDHDFLFQVAPTNPPQAKLYLQRLKRLVRQLLPYIQVEVLLDLTDRLPLKGSPVDGGKVIYEQLYQSRWLVESETFLDELEQAWGQQPPSNEGMREGEMG